MSHVFDGYAPWAGDLKTRQNGSLVASESGSAFAYSIWKLQERGSFFITPATEVYVGMVVGENSRENDLNVNVCKNKKLTNVPHPAPTTPSTSRPSESCHSRTLSNISVRTSSSRSHQSPSACAKRSSNRACGSKILRSAGVQVSCLIFLKLLRSC